MNFAKQHDSFSVKHLLDLYLQEKLNLEPGFQRASVWTKKDQLALIDTILRQMPLPNLFAGGGAARGISGPGNAGYLAGNGLLAATALGRLAGKAAAKLVG